MPKLSRSERLACRIVYGLNWSQHADKGKRKETAILIVQKINALRGENWTPTSLINPTADDTALVKQAQSMITGAASAPAPAPREVTRGQLRRQQDMFETDNDREMYRGALGLYGLDEARNTADLRKKLGARTDWPAYVKAGMEAFIKSVEQGGDAPAPALAW